MRLTVISLLLLVLPFFGFSQIAGDFRSTSPGDWNTPGNWEEFNGTTWVAAGAAPSAADNVITIRPGHSITIPNGDVVTVDQLFLQGNLTVLAGGTLSIANGAGDDITIANGTSTLYISGTLNRGDLTSISNTFSSSNIVFGSGGVYNHNYTNSVGDLFPSTWNEASTVAIVGFTNTSTIVGNNTWDQQFGNFVYNCPGQLGIVDFDGGIKTIKGDLSVVNTNSRLVFFSSGGNDVLSIGDADSPVGGDLVISGTSRVAMSTTGILVMNVYGNFEFTAPHSMGSFLSTTGTTTLNIYGDFTMDATANGKLRLASIGTTGSTTLNLFRNFSLLSGRLEEIGNTPTQGNLNFVGSGQQDFLNTGIIAGYINYYVAPTSTLDLSIYPLTGISPSSLVVDGGLIVGSPEPTGAITATTTAGNIRVPLANRTYNSGATITYQGSEKLFLGNGHPGNAGVTTVIDNAAGVDMVSDFTTSGVLRLENGTLSLNDFRLTSAGTLETINGNFAGSALSSIVVTGTGSGNWGTLNFLPTDDQLNLLQISRSGAGSEVGIASTVTILSNLNLLSGTLANSGTVRMADNSTVTRYDAGSLTGNELVAASGAFHVTYRTNSPSGGPYANMITGPELPSNSTDLGNLLILALRDEDQVVLNHDISINGIFNLSNGTFSPGAFDITQQGIQWLDNAGTFNPGTGTVIFNADSTRVYGVQTPVFGNVRVNTGRKAEFARSFIVQGNMEVQAGGEVGMSNYIMTLSGGNLQTISANGATFSNINVAKSGGQDIVLTSAMNVTGILQFVSPSANVNFQSDGFLVLRSVSDAGGVLTTASVGRLVSGNTVSGVVEVQRFIADEGNMYRYLSSPVSGSSVAQLQDDILVQGNFADPSPTQTICGVTAHSSSPNLYWYNETVAGGINSGHTPYPSPGNTAAGSPLVVGLGYSAYIWQCGDPTLIDFQGPINQGNINLPVTYTVSDPAGDGWNLVGNPYPSTIDWDASGWTKTRIANSFAIRDNVSGMTRHYEAGVTEEVPNGQIATAQAFWVLATGANPILTIRETTKVTTVAEFYRERPQFIPSLVIALSDGQYTDKAYLKTIPEGRPALDTMDVPKIFNPNFSLSTLTSDHRPMAINALQELSCGTPLSLRTDGLIPGTYSLSLDSRQFFESYSFVLVDNFTNRRTNIKDALYLFTVTEDSLSAVVDRFTILIESQVPDMSLAVSAPAAACEDISQVSIATTTKSARYSIWSADGTQLTEPFEGSGAELTIPVKTDSLSEGVNELNVYVHAGCLALPATASFSIVKSSPVVFNVATQMNCEKGTNLFTAQTSTEAIFLWFEEEAGGKPLHEGIAFETPVLDSDGTYFVAARNAVTGCLGERVAVQAVKPELVVPEIEVDGMTLTSTIDEGNQWYRDGNLINGANGKELVMTSPGLYELVTNANGCVSSASYLLEETSIPGIRVYPNPVVDRLQIEGIGNDVLSIELASTVGQTLSTIYRKGQKFDGEISLGSVPDGLYLLIVTKADQKHAYRLFKRTK